MRINRRKFVVTASVAAVGLALSDAKLLAAPTRARTWPPSLKTILEVSWDQALETMRDGKLWVSPTLNQWTAEGRIKIMPLGANVAVVEERPLDYRYNPGKPGEIYTSAEDCSQLPLTVVDRITQYDVKQYNVPVVFTRREELRLRTDKQRVSFCATLIENAVYANEHQLKQAMAKLNASAVVSRAYRVERGDIYKIPDHSDGYYFMVYTAATLVPGVTNLNTVKILT